MRRTVREHAREALVDEKLGFVPVIRVARQDNGAVSHEGLGNKRAGTYQRARLIWVGNDAGPFVQLLRNGK